MRLWLITFLLVLLQPIVVLILFRFNWSVAWRWIENDPSVNIFLLFFVPTILYIFVHALPPDRNALWQSLSKFDHIFISVVLFLGLSFIFHGAYFADLKDRLLPPFQVKKISPLKAAETHYTSLRAVLTDGKDRKDPKIAADEYRQKTGQFSEANWTFYVTTTHSFLAVSLGFCYLCYLIAILRSPTASDRVVPKLLVCLLLFTFFFPARFYSDWYLNFGSLDLQKPIYWLLVALTVLGAVFVAYVFYRSAPEKAILAVVGGLGTLTTVVAILKPDWFQFLAHVYERGGVFAFLVVLFLSSIVLYVTVGLFL